MRRATEFRTETPREMEGAEPWYSSELCQRNIPLDVCLDKFHEHPDLRLCETAVGGEFAEGNAGIGTQKMDAPLYFQSLRIESAAWPALLQFVREIRHDCCGNWASGISLSQTLALPFSMRRFSMARALSALEIGHELGGHTEPGRLVSNHLIRKAAYDAVHDGMAENYDVALLAAEKVNGVKTDHISARVTLESGKTISASLIVAADSRFSPTRKMMGISADMRDFGKSMLVCRMTLEQPHHHTAWEWAGYGQTLALLPMNRERTTNVHRSSVVLTLPGREVTDLAHLDPDEFSTNIAQRFARRLGATKLVSTRHVYPLVSVYSERFVGKRFATAGDAAVGMHPVTAHGFNFGLAGVETLCKEIVTARRNGFDIAAESVLSRYEDRHRRTTKPLFLATRFITDIYTSNTVPARLARNIMLRAASRLNAVQESHSGFIDRLVVCVCFT
jgi:ubiquinone biosynthesis UbiH/UbiF/VisC/COQ6 family hydroxylase